MEPASGSDVSQINLLGVPLPDCKANKPTFVGLWRCGVVAFSMASRKWEVGSGKLTPMRMKKCHSGTVYIEYVEYVEESLKMSRLPPKFTVAEQKNVFRQRPACLRGAALVGPNGAGAEARCDADQKQGTARAHGARQSAI